MMRSFRALTDDDRSTTRRSCFLTRSIYLAKAWVKRNEPIQDIFRRVGRRVDLDAGRSAVRCRPSGTACAGTPPMSVTRPDIGAAGSAASASPAAARTLRSAGPDPRPAAARRHRSNAIRSPTAERSHYFFEDPFARTLWPHRAPAMAQASGNLSGLGRLGRSSPGAFQSASSTVRRPAAAIEGGNRLVDLTAIAALPFVALLRIDDDNDFGYRIDDFPPSSRAIGSLNVAALGIAGAILSCQLSTA